MTSVRPARGKPKPGARRRPATPADNSREAVAAMTLDQKRALLTRMLRQLRDDTERTLANSKDLLATFS